MSATPHTARPERHDPSLSAPPCGAEPMFGTPTVGVLAVKTRGDLVESFGTGMLSATAGPHGPNFCVGDTQIDMFPRSTLKPFQALAMVDAGLDLPRHLLALACASHSGLSQHLTGVREILHLVGLDESALQNTPDYPLNAQAEQEARHASQQPTSLFQNCSGKHAAMLATCVIAGWDRKTYLDPHHPLQQAIRRTLVEWMPNAGAHVSTDGCGAPLFSAHLMELARACAALAGAQPGTHARAVADAMRAHPDLVGGPGRLATQVMQQCPGVIAKDGAEAVFVLGTDTGAGFALKMADGRDTFTPVVVQAVCEALGIDGDWSAVTMPQVLGHGIPVGSVVAVDLPRLG